MTKFAFGKIACLVSAVGTFAALQVSAPANAANETAAIVLPAMATTAAAPAAGESVEMPSDDAASPANRTITTPKADARQIECVAKVIVHEAGNQPRRGQAAVAQVIRTRSQDPRFGDSACAVVRQPASSSMSMPTTRRATMHAGPRPSTLLPKLLTDKAPTRFPARCSSTRSAAR